MGPNPSPFLPFFYLFFFLPRDIGFIGHFPAGGVPLLLTLARLGGGGRGAGGGHPFFLPLGTLGLAQSWILSDANFR